MNGYKQDYLDSVALNMSVIVRQHNYGTINIDDNKAEVIYILQFKAMPYKIKDSIELNRDTITEGTLVCSAQYMSPAQ